MSTFHFNKFEACNKKQIIQKFSFRFGAKFYSSGREAVQLVDDVKPIWHLPDRYDLGYWSDSNVPYLVHDNAPNIATITIEKFYRVGKVLLADSKPNYIKDVIVPQLSRLGEVRQLMASTKNATLKFCDKYYDASSDFFKGENLTIVVDPDNEQSYSTTKKIFELARNRKQLGLHLISKSDGDYYRLPCYDKMIIKFLENWLKGDSIGSLEKLTFTKEEAQTLSKIPFYYERVVKYEQLEAAIKKFAKRQGLRKNCVQKSDGFVLTGDYGKLLLSLCRSTPRVDIHFV